MKAGGSSTSPSKPIAAGAPGGRWGSVVFGWRALRPTYRVCSRLSFVSVINSLTTHRSGKNSQGAQNPGDEGNSLFQKLTLPHQPVNPRARAASTARPLDGGPRSLIPRRRTRCYLLPWRAARAAARPPVPALGPPPGRGRQAAVLPSPPPRRREPDGARARARVRVQVRVRARASSRVPSGYGWDLARVQWGCSSGVAVGMATGHRGHQLVAVGEGAWVEHPCAARPRRRHRCGRLTGHLYAATEEAESTRTRGWSGRHVGGVGACASGHAKRAKHVRGLSGRHRAATNHAESTKHVAAAATTTTRRAPHR